MTTDHDRRERELATLKTYTHARWAYLQALLDIHAIGTCRDWRAEIVSLERVFGQSLQTLDAL